MKVRTETFFDGSYWDASLPDGWTFRQDKSVRGFPYVFESSPNCRMQIGNARDVKINYGAGVTLPGIASESHRVAYVQTLQGAWINEGTSLFSCFLAILRRAVGVKLPIQMHELGGMVGFTYPIKSTGLSGWAGHFSADPWTLYIRMSAPVEVMEQKSREALAIVDSVRFHPGVK